MRIAVPVNEKNMETTVCPSFGRTPFFLVYDTQTQEASYEDNSAASSQGGAGIKAAQALADSKVEAVLAPRMGENASDVLVAAGIAVYKTQGDNLQENLKAFEEGQLKALEETHSGFHGHGGQ
ncbi:NifB/NifX family molybdenum-iron cluster-binding protein [Anaerotalea alkaliphila]|uniref:Dinitrogenase iron-molybdenum cofactor biosynthesis protein n=1 Tax=Anaerotalea alkaliphila TaxID=2662126 RepID=A0A7X5KPR3_9FIRM|nr:NifB/NifX family molybdenum-iron cluster-binding protein [Anaerotalea alkaliphila]NDL68807.1 dinitrogenase iron-molybdenum cofactor biosynthesis protein [Anaerotalea alkaliphila]